MLIPSLWLWLMCLDCANADHEGAAEAFLKGLAAHALDKPGHLIHTSGTGILMFKDIESQIIGEASSKVFDDWDGIEEVISIPDFAPHRLVDKIVLAGSTKHRSNVKTAIICPPCIYGKGRGPGNQRSIQIYDLAKAILSKKQGIQVGPGKTYWNNVHIRDLSDLYLKLVEAATTGAGNAFWNNQGYYFAENGEHVWGEISRKIASEAHRQGHNPSNEVISVTGQEADQLMAHSSFLWGGNSRASAIRARKLLGWTPKERSIEDEIPEVVSSEAKLLGIVKGHAAKVAG